MFRILVGVRQGAIIRGQHVHPNNGSSTRVLLSRGRLTAAVDPRASTSSHSVRYFSGRMADDYLSFKKRQRQSCGSSDFCISNHLVSFSTAAANDNDNNEQEQQQDEDTTSVEAFFESLMRSRIGSTIQYQKKRITFADEAKLEGSYKVWNKTRDEFAETLMKIHKDRTFFILAEVPEPGDDDEQPSSSKPSSNENKDTTADVVSESEEDEDAPVVTLESADKKLIEQQVKASQKAKRRRKNKKQSMANAKRVFDLIAPHVPLGAVKRWKRKLENANNLSSHDSIAKRVHYALNNTITGKRSAAPTWVMNVLVQFFAANDDIQVNSHDTKEDTNYGPRVNRKNWETHVDTLLKARELAVKPFLEISAREKEKALETSTTTATDATEEADAIQEKNATTEGADATQEETAPVDPKHKHTARATAHAMRIAAHHESKSQQVLKQQAEQLAAALANRLPPASYDNLMKMFASYVATQDPDLDRKTKGPKRVKIDNLKRRCKEHVIWIASDTAKFFYMVPEIVEEATEQQPQKKQKITAARRLSPEKGKVGRKKKYVHLKFDALGKPDRWEVTEENGEIDHPSEFASLPSDRSVFINNLPIDITEKDIIDLYSRCGTVDSVQLFNQRPDLDPGRLTIKQRKEIQKKNRRSMKQRRRWQRPRTPLYGIIHFATEEGYRRATDDSLCIFGMVIRRHAVMSTPAERMKKLFLENIPPGYVSLDLEHKMSTLLSPAVYVCLDRNHYDYAQPTSCEIEFPTFEMAYYSFQKLQELDMVKQDECQVQWMRTPQDAEKYWTRQLAFDK